MRKGKIGIVANPQSGRDIRRLVAHASVFNNEEKVNIVERLLSTWNRMGLESVVYMPDSYGIVERASERTRGLNIKLQPLDMLLDIIEKDSVRASVRAGKLLQSNVDVIIVIGGDGTHRAVIKGIDLSDPTPIIGISTGTNNVFPSMVEATVVALSSWAIASRTVKKEEAVRREKVLYLSWKNGNDIALIDVVFTGESFIGSRALWEPQSIEGIFSSRAGPQNIGFSSLPGILVPSGNDEPFGSFTLLDSLGDKLVFPVAPGKLIEVSVSKYGKLYNGKPFVYHFKKGTIALDGEREIEIYGEDDFLITLSTEGPLTVDIPLSLKLGAERGLFKG